MSPASIHTRREWLKLAGGGLAAGLFAAAPAAAGHAAPLKLATFRCDVTPPLGHSLCGGWIKPALAVDDPLEAIGLVLLGADRPFVICAVDWTGILNSGYAALCESLARAVGTTPDRVAVQCVHQHNTPFACLETQALVARQEGLPPVVDPAFLASTFEAVAAAARTSLAGARPLTHVAAGEAAVEQVASNRRLIGPDGLCGPLRGSSSKDPAHHAAPEGLIDPMLKSIGFYSGEQLVAVCHTYACHPMSYYGDGRVSADFCGLARRRREQETKDCVHLYFDGCGGNIGAGKYNDGSREMRPVLARRIYDALVASEQAFLPQPIETIGWRTMDVRLPPDPTRRPDELSARLADASQAGVQRSLAAFVLAYQQRFETAPAIPLTALHVNRISQVHLPAESFVEYQLWAQNMAPGRFVACPAYGDGGPWYLPTRDAFPQGGYEVSAAWCGPDCEDELLRGLRGLLASV